MCSGALWGFVIASERVRETWGKAAMGKSTQDAALKSNSAQERGITCVGVAYDESSSALPYYLDKRPHFSGSQSTVQTNAA